MSKWCKKESKRRLVISSGTDSAKSNKIDHESSLISVIGSSNVKRWNDLKITLECVSDESFVNLLLDFAENHINRNNCTAKEDQLVKNDKPKEAHLTNRSEELKFKQNPLIHDEKEQDKVQDVCKGNEVTSGLVSEKVANEELCNSDTENVLKASKSLMTVENKNNVSDLPSNQNEKLERKKDSTQNLDKVNKKQKCVDKRNDKQKKKIDVDIRKAPEFNAQVANHFKCTENMDVVDVHVKSEEVEEDENLAVKVKLCNGCNCRHIQDHCPLQFPHYAISDALSVDQVKQPKCESKTNDNDENEASEEDSIKNTFTYLSLPYVLGLVQTNTLHGLGVICKDNIKQFTEFGPLTGKVVKEVDISEDSTMRDVWEVNAPDGTHIYISTEDLQYSNWMRFVRPAPSRDVRNICVVSKSSKLYFATMKNLTSGEELLYWQDDTINSNKKKMEKTSCGGCNMNFTHPLYYRLHCSIFHDMRYSLTIRKYHCKVCGAAILGKENIMKHAAELHNGQGAYQCQFCKKFFLRLNYLEMHRTYGCSANPHRSRPLCDFCGRKFCQPQKLKVHIKRMHSDMSEVLKEFQCKNCLKILGSPAALQRHLKEVHQKQVDGACACSKCGKLFQNKSNLKIHMLTHSGIKPFKCMENKCIAAFTTKQCLQFHYKKVHGLAEDMMPKIERSVDYTFEAYSGLDDYDSSGNANKVETSPMKSDSFRCSSNTSEIDENSMDEKVVEDPLALNSPIQLHGNEHSSESNGSPPTLEAFAPSMKILTKGSKKWIAEESLQILKTDLYHVEKNRNCKTEEAKTISLDVDEPQVYDTPKLSTNLNAFNRHESSNASLLVEAALDSVCSEPNIDIDVNSTTNCTDTLVNNLYTLSHADMPDVTYSHSVDMSESRDINLISPSVNDHISVTDDLNDELKNTHNMGIDYSNFQQEDFSPPSSPNVQNRNNFVRDYINVNVVSPQNYDTNVPKNLCQIPSPPRYNFTHNINADQSSDDSNGIGAQNLSVHNSKDSIQLDLSIYKSHYNLDANFQFRKDFRIKFDTEPDRKQVYILDVDNVSKSYNDVHKFNLTENADHTIANLQGELSEKDFENVQDIKHKDAVESSIRSNVSDLRNKFDLDLDVRTKTYDNGDNCDIRSRNLYDSTVDDFRIKNYDLIENLDTRNNLDGRNLLDGEFRSDRNFDHLVLNTSELQGLDMSARSYHNYSNLNRYHHLYSEVERPSVDLRLNYSSPPPTYTHADILRVVSLDLTPPGRHSVDLSLRSHQIANSRILSDHGLQSNSHRLSLDQGRILTNELSATRHLSPETRLLSVSDMSNRILSDHTTNRLLSVSNDVTTNRLITSEDSRLISEQPRLLDQSRILGDGRIIPPGSNNAAISPVPYSGYSVSPSPYHPTALPPRSPNSTPYHHYSTYY